MQNCCPATLPGGFTSFSPLRSRKMKSFGSSFAFAGTRGAFTTFERADEPEDAAPPEGLIGLAGAESGPTAYLAPSALCVASSALEKRQPISPARNDRNSRVPTEAKEGAERTTRPRRKGRDARRRTARFARRETRRDE